MSESPRRQRSRDFGRACFLFHHCLVAWSYPKQRIQVGWKVLNLLYLLPTALQFRFHWLRPGTNLPPPSSSSPPSPPSASSFSPPPPFPCPLPASCLALAVAAPAPGPLYFVSSIRTMVFRRFPEVTSWSLYANRVVYPDLHGSYRGNKAVSVSPCVSLDVFK